MDLTEQLIRIVEDRYGIRVKKVKVIRDVKNSSFVAKLVTDQGAAYVLKTLYRKARAERQRFIAATEQLLDRRDVPLAKPVPAKNGDLYIEYDGESYVLYSWIDGTDGKLRNIDDLKKIVRIMARMHQASRKLNYPADVKLYDHPSWEQEYNDRIQLMQRWQTEVFNPENKRDIVIGRSIPFFVKMGERALKRLRRSGYARYRQLPAYERTLVHGDLHHKNVMLQGDKAVLIDFEDVRYDVPSKDLLRIYSLYTKNYGFREDEFESMMQTYERIHPLRADEKQLVYIDFLFPHIFERMLRKKKYVELKAKELRHWIHQEEKKMDYVYRRYFKNRNDLEGDR